MSPQDPLERLLVGAFNRELHQLESTVTVDRVMAQVRRYNQLRRLAVTIVVVLAVVVLMFTVPDVLWILSWLGEIRFNNLAIPAVVPLLCLFLPWLLALFDDQV